MTRVLIVGHGYVGKAYAGLFERKYQVQIEDPGQGLRVHEDDKAGADLAVICVPTPSGRDGECDSSLVRQAVKALPKSIRRVMIKSTVAPGTTQEIACENNRPLVFSPEYVGEGGYHVPPQFPSPRDPASHGWLILGATWETEEAPCGMDGIPIAGEIADLMIPIIGPTTRVRVMAAEDAEMIKYFENSWLATKVTFVNEMRRICEAAGANYHVIREGWLDDPRVGGSHSFAFAQRPGFDGKCLPKDTAALEAWCRAAGIPTPLLSAVINANGGNRGH